MHGSLERERGKLEYEVALYREATEDTTETVEAVPIGTRLQLRVRLGPGSVWRYIRLLELSLSPSSADPHAAGHVQLVQAG